MSILKSRLSTIRSTASRTFTTTSHLHIDTPAGEDSLNGTVVDHQLYLLLHTAEPPSAYPTKKTTQLYRTLQLQFLEWGAKVNFAYRPDLLDDLPPSTEKPEKENYRATAYSRKIGILEIPSLTMDNLDDIDEALEAESTKVWSDGQFPMTDQVHLYVCTHMQRDCRCGNIGGSVVQAIREEVERRGIEKTVKVGEVGHIGGHAWAANMMVYPHGDWLGKLQPENVPKVLDAILALPRRPLPPTAPPLCPEHWRGRQGLSKEDQLGLFNRRTW